MRHSLLRPFLLLGAALCLGACGIYSFSGTSIQNDVQSIHIEYFEYKAQKVNPTLSNDLTEELRTRFRRMTRLEQVDQDPDLEIVGEVTGYSIAASTVGAGDTAQSNRLTVTIRVSSTNRKYPEDDFTDKSFSAYADFPATQELAAVETDLCKEIIDKLIDDIFNATVAQW